MRRPRGFRLRSLLRGASLLALLLGAAPSHAFAASAEEIDRKVEDALERFYAEVRPGSTLASQAAGMLVFPKVYKAGIGIGGEYGEGALRIGGESVGYYRTTSGSVGLQLGAQARTIVLLFMDEETLARFRQSDGWKVGVDGSVTLVDVGAGAGTDTDRLRDPILGFVIGKKGLMYNLTLEGSKYWRLDKKRASGEGRPAPGAEGEGEEEPEAETHPPSETPGADEDAGDDAEPS